MKDNLRRVFSLFLSVIITVSASVFTANITVNADEGSAAWNGTVSNGFESGDGTEGNPYIIKTAEQLAYLAKSVNEGNGYVGSYFELANDISLNMSNCFEYDGNNNIIGVADDKEPLVWTPIGIFEEYRCNGFSGSFNGNGYKITGVYVDSKDLGVGLFGYCKDAVIRNLKVEDSFIKGESYVGSTIGYSVADNGKSIVDNCYSSSTVIGESFVGGVAGGITARSGNASVVVSGCVSDGLTEGADGCGGIVGISSASNEGASVSVENCKNNGTVSGCELPPEKAVTGAASGGYNLGGVVGENLSESGKATVKGCINNGFVSGNANVGGVVGYNVADMNLISDAIVANCYNYGNVEGKNGGIGGVVGNVCANSGCAYVRYCFNEGTMSCECGYIGGIVGTISSSGKTYVMYCANSGVINGARNTGGVVGDNRVSTGLSTITDCYNCGTINGTENVGGVVGYNGVYSQTAAIVVSVCYNAGDINADADFGGVVGWNTAEIEGASIVVRICYYLRDVAGNACNTSGTDAGTIIVEYPISLREEELSYGLDLIGFDFGNIWTMDGNPDYPYPELIVKSIDDSGEEEQSGVVYGDINGDGKIKGNDATVFLKYLAGWNVSISEANADCNGDGKIKGNDATILLKYLAGWRVTLGRQ